MEDQKSRIEIKSIEASGDNNEGCYLTPIEEETESNISSRRILRNCSDSEAEDDAEESYKNNFRPIKEDDNDSVINGEVQIGSRRKNLEMIVELLKSKVFDSEKEILALKKELSLEKIRSHEFLLRCREKNLKANQLLKVELEDWKDIMARRIQNQMVEWQLIEQKKVNEEIMRISEINYQDIRRTLKNDIEKWHVQDAERANNVIQERCRQEMEAESAQRIYGMIQSHMESLEKRNKEAYEGFRKQIDAWEQHLKEEVVKVHEDDLKKLRHQVKGWYEELVKNWRYADALKKPGQIEAQKTGHEIVEDRLLKRLRECNHEDIFKIEKNLKTELQAHREESAKKINDEIGELWVAFEQFKHNFSLNYEYESGFRNNYSVDRVDIDSDASYAGSKVVDAFSDKSIQRSRTNVDTKMTKDRNEERRSRRQGRKKSKHVSFDKPIASQVPNDSYTRK